MVHTARNLQARRSLISPLHSWGLNAPDEENSKKNPPLRRGILRFKSDATDGTDATDFTDPTDPTDLTDNTDNTDLADLTDLTDNTDLTDTIESSMLC